VTQNYAYIKNVYKHGRRRKIWRKKEERTEGGEKIYTESPTINCTSVIQPLDQGIARRFKSINI